jgi:hypothetical protein
MGCFPVQPIGGYPRGDSLLMLAIRRRSNRRASRWMQALSAGASRAVDTGQTGIDNR